MRFRAESSLRPRGVGLIVAGLLLACDPGPEPIAYGIDQCATCHMGIADPRFGSEAVSNTGKIWKFDSVEDLAAFANYPPQGQVLRSLWVSDFANPGEFTDPSDLFPAESAQFLISDDLHSPMGLGIAAFRTAGERDAALASFQGRAATWDDVTAFVELEWPGGTPGGSRFREGADEHTSHLGPQERGSPDASSGPSAGRNSAQYDLVVDPTGEYPTVSEAVRAAPSGARVLVRAGVYQEAERIVLTSPITLQGEPGAILDGELSGQILEIRSDSVTVRGLTFRNVATSFVEDRSAIKVEVSRHCVIEDNTLESTFFGIYLANSGDCRIAGNVLRADRTRESASGNGIHLWYSKNIEIVDNDIRGHRDGIYFEFVEDSWVTGNVSEENLRYGLHFMFSDNCTYRRNRFAENGVGVAVMYTEGVVMEENDFAHNWGNAAFGLLLKDIRDSVLQNNRFWGNSTGLYAEGANRLQVVGNEFRENGWAVKIMANTEDASFTRNNFVANSFDLATNSRRTWSEFDGNYWDEYGGYDLDKDGVGDVPFRPVRLFALLVERNEPSLVLLRSFLSDLLDLAEAVLPLLTPEDLADHEPSMWPLATSWTTP